MPAASEFSQAPPATTPKDPSSFVVIGQNYWGKGKTLDVAKSNFRRQGGQMNRGYTILTFDADTEFQGVGEVYGEVSWVGNHPHVREVAAR